MDLIIKGQVKILWKLSICYQLCKVKIMKILLKKSGLLTIIQVYKININLNKRIVQVLSRSNNIINPPSILYSNTCICIKFLNRE